MEGFRTWSKPLITCFFYFFIFYFCTKCYVVASNCSLAYAG